MNEAPAPRVVTLSFAQRRVLGQLTLDGASNRVIAGRLGIVEDTVKCHMRDILAAFGVHERAAVAVACLRRQVIIRTVHQPKNEQRGRPTKPPIKHGTAGGYRSHKLRGIDPCEPCSTAISEHMQWVRSKIKDRAA